MPEMQVIKIDSFKGGRTNFLDQTTIDPSMCASGSMNVWAPQGILTKSPGLSLVQSFTASGTANVTGGNVQVQGLWVNDSLTTSFSVFYEITHFSSATAIGVTVSGLFSYLWGSSYSLGDSVTALGYTKGTIAINGVSATGSGTSWLTDANLLLLSGDRLLYAQNPTANFQIVSVADNTHLTIDSPVPTAVSAGTHYTIQMALPGVRNDSMCVLNGLMVINNATSVYSTAFTSFNPLIYDGTNTYRLYQLTTGSGYIATPASSFQEVFQGYMFWGAPAYPVGSTSWYPSRVAWSVINDPSSFFTNNFIDIDINNNGNIAGLKAFGQELIVFKQRAMYKIIGNVFDPTNPTYSVQKITTPPDFLFNSNRSVVVHTKSNADITYSNTGINYNNTVLLFYGGGFIYSYISGTSFITRISDRIALDLPLSKAGTIAGFAFQNTINVDDQAITGISHNGYYILTGFKSPNFTDPSNSVAILMDRNNSFWLLHNDNNSGVSSSWYGDPFGSIANSTVFTNQGPYMCVLPEISSRPTVLISSNTGDSWGRIYSFSLFGPTYNNTYPLADANNTTPTFTASSINGIWISKEFNIDYGYFHKIIVYLQKQSSGNLTLQWSIDQGSFNSTSIDMTTGRGNVIRFVQSINQKGSTIQLKLSNNVASQTFGIYAIKIYYTPSDEERIA